jgi:hypothetical protein
MKDHNDNSHPDLHTDLGLKRNSGHVPWLDIYTRQSEFINQVEYMPIHKRGGCGSLMAPTKFSASSLALA